MESSEENEIIPLTVSALDEQTTSTCSLVINSLLVIMARSVVKTLSVVCFYLQDYHAYFQISITLNQKRANL